jgi:hypothetical protein
MHRGSGTQGFKTTPNQRTMRCALTGPSSRVRAWMPI